MDEKTIARFWRKVDRHGSPPEHLPSLGGCFVWRGGIKNGYGYFETGGRRYYAHRIAWELDVGAILGGLCVLHRCDNPRCVRIEHLFLGTRTDNALDKVSKGRALGARNPRRGNAHPNARLRELDAKRIRELYAAGGCTMLALAGRFGVSKRTVLNVIHRRIWV